MKLIEIRNEIDRVDGEILSLLAKRMMLSVRAGKTKDRIIDRKREREILRKMKYRNDRLLTSKFKEKLYIDIMSESKRLQESKFRLAGFQGERGAFGEVACNMFDDSLVPVPCLDFADVFEGVLRGEFDFGVIPIENSTEGIISAASHLVTEKGLFVIGEVIVPVHHALLSLPNTDLEDIRTVYSHPQALAQCRNFIGDNKLEPRPFFDTAGAAEMISRERPAGAAAIAGKICSELYGMKVLKENIEDSESNFTRFLVLSKDAKAEAGNKCTVTLSTMDKVGALTSILKIFKDSGINLTMIESLPSRDSSGRVKFLIDFIGNDFEKRYVDALEMLKEEAAEFRMLGCYRRWVR